MSGYPETFPTSEPELADLRAQLESWKYACRQAAGIGSGRPALLNTVLHLDTPYTERRYPFKSACDAVPAARAPLTLNPRVSCFARPSAGRDRVQLVKALQTGVAQGWAQVYAGRFLPESDSDTEVIVKVYQGSYSQGLDDILTSDMKPEGSDYENLLTPFRNEAWAYAQLVQFQGSLVPYVHGFFKVVLPHGEPAIVLVMEYVRGTHLLPLPDGYQTSPKALDDVMNKLLRCMQNMELSGVHTFDLAVRNVIWPPLTASGELSHPIFIDFDQLIEPAPDVTISHVIDLVVHYGFEERKIGQWIHSNMISGSEIVRWFAISDDQLPRKRRTALEKGTGKKIFDPQD